MLPKKCFKPSIKVFGKWTQSQSQSMRKHLKCRKYMPSEKIWNRGIRLFNLFNCSFFGKRETYFRWDIQSSNLVRSIRAVRVLVTDSIIRDTHRGFHTHANCFHHLRTQSVSQSFVQSPNHTLLVDPKWKTLSCTFFTNLFVFVTGSHKATNIGLKKHSFFSSRKRFKSAWFKSDYGFDVFAIFETFETFESFRWHFPRNDSGQCWKIKKRKGIKIITLCREKRCGQAFQAL